MEIFYFLMVLREARESYACSQHLTLPSEQERKGRVKKGFLTREAEGLRALLWLQH